MPDHAEDAPRYRVEIPFRAATNGRLTQAPYVLPDGARVERHIRPQDRPAGERPATLVKVQKTFDAQGSPIAVDDADEGEDESLAGQYRYCLTLQTRTAEEAVAAAEANAKALLVAFAANQMAFEIGPPEDRYITRLDPPTDQVPDTELPLETVNIRTDDMAAVARTVDPTGQLRRAGKVFSSNPESVVKRPRITLEGELYGGHAHWDERLERGAEIYRLGQCSADPTVRFLLSCLAFEVLVDHERTPVLVMHLPTKTDRRNAMTAVDEALGVAGIPGAARERIIERARTTEAESYTASAAAYLDRLGLSFPHENVVWVQQQRGALVHAGAIDDSGDAAELRNDFLKIVGVALQREMARIVGRAVDDLVPATTFSRLTVWDPGDGSGLRLQPG